MSGTSCGQIRHLIPDVAGDRVAAQEVQRVETHLAGCADCADELRLARLVHASRPDAPEGLAARVSEAVRRDRASGRSAATRVGPHREGRSGADRRWWGVAAAAVAAIAVGIGMRSGSPAVPAVVPAYAQEIEEGGWWISDDGLVAGSPTLDGLSEEALLRLLDDLSAENGGPA